MIQPAFSRANVHRLIPLMRSCCRSREQRWREIARNGATLNITQETSDFALELILRSIFGTDYERRIIAGRSNPFAFLSEDPTRDLRVVLRVRELRTLLLEVIARRREHPAGDDYDFLSIYLAARDKAGNAFTDDELLDELMTLIIAGYETSAGTLNWGWYLLARYPDMHAAVVDEAWRCVPPDKPITGAEVGQMPYTQSFLEETLRLYPPVWLFTRRVDESDSLERFDLPAGSDIYLSPYILHRTEDFWPDPERVDPSRFDSSGAAGKVERPYFPFSLGPRRCLGEYFSFLEMKIHLGMLAPLFGMSLVDETPPQLDLGINLRSQSDVFLRPGLRDPQ